MVITVFDTETTGLRSERHEIIELAFITYLYDDDGNRSVLKKYESKIKPQNIHTAEPAALEINGYEESKWENAPDFSEIHEVVLKAFEDSDLLMGQNLIFENMSFLPLKHDQEYENINNIIDIPYNLRGMETNNNEVREPIKSE